MTVNIWPEVIGGVISFILLVVGIIVAALGWFIKTTIDEVRGDVKDLQGSVSDLQTDTTYLKGAVAALNHEAPPVGPTRRKAQQ